MYEELAQLFGGYLHQDFDLEYGSPDAAVREYATVGPENAVRAVRDIDALVAEGLPEARLGERLFTLGCDYYFAAGGYSAYGWLAHVRDLLTAEIDRAAGFTVRFGDGDLHRTRSGVVVFPIWVRTGGIDFPEPGWPDFPVVLLTKWILEFVAVADLGPDGPGSVELGFMKGPYAVRLARTEDPERWAVTPRWAGSEAGQAAEVDEATVLERLWHPALSLVVACRSHGWDDVGVRCLSTAMSALEGRGRIRG